MKNMNLLKLKLEHTECEFKRKVEHIKTKNWLKDVNAFANGIGGVLIFGIDDATREFVPIDDIQNEIEFIASCIKDRISPIPDFILESEVLEEGRQILVLKVKGGLNTPYYLTENAKKITFIRVGSSSVQADTPILHELILKGTNKTWDTLKSEFAVKDYSFTYLESYYFNVTGERLLPSDYLLFGLVTKDGFLTNAGTLFTDICPLRQSRIFCTRWNGLTKADSAKDALDDKEFNGNILLLLHSSQDFIKVYNTKSWYKTNFSRMEKQSYPERAVFEALINALVHRDYDVIGEEIHIDIFDNRLEIKNPGGMYDGVLVQNQNIDDVISTRRNPMLADFMQRLNLMERRGSGFRKILSAVKHEPGFVAGELTDFSSSAYNFAFSLKNMNYQPSESDTATVENKFNPINLLELVRKNPEASYEEYATMLGVSAATVKRRLGELKNAGKIERVGAKKNNSWKIK